MQLKVYLAGDIRCRYLDAREQRKIDITERGRQVKQLMRLMRSYMQISMLMSVFSRVFLHGLTA